MLVLLSLVLGLWMWGRVLFGLGSLMGGVGRITNSVLVVEDGLFLIMRCNRLEAEQNTLLTNIRLITLLNGRAC